MATGRTWLSVVILAGCASLVMACNREPEAAGPKEQEPMKGTTQAGTMPADAARAELVFSGGHETDPRDMGRPVILVAAGLGVPAEVFRETFTHVTPAAGGREPDPAQVQRNKQALLAGLGKYGVSNELLDTVSDYYRYPPGPGNMWKNRPAKGYATVKDGQVTAIVITDGGAGYSSPPAVSVSGMPGVKAKATVWYGKDLAKNGSVEKVELEK